MAKIRTFIACDIPETLLEKILNLQDKLKGLDADVSWTKISGIHITLKFLGDIEEGSIDKIASVILDAAKGQSSFEIKIKGSGSFPSLKNPRVIWLGVMDEAGRLSSIQQALDSGLKALGFEPDEREFRPHLTLGRVKGAKGKERLSSAISGLKDVEIGSFPIDRVIFYKSELKPAGAIYTKLKDIMLL